MSKHNPNQDFYKIGGRSQTDGPDRGEPPSKTADETHPRASRNAHPAVKRSAKKK